MKSTSLIARIAHSTWLTGAACGLSIVLFSGCSSRGGESDATEHEAPLADDDGVILIDPNLDTPPELFGAALADGVTTVGVTEITSAPEPHMGATIETTGIVRASCQLAGCWMEVRPEGDESTRAVTVRFKNYGFFVPFDSPGRKARMQGQLQVHVMSPAEVHAAMSEGATVPGVLPDGSARVVTFIATGVELRRVPVTPPSSDESPSDS